MEYDLTGLRTELANCAEKKHREGMVNFFKEKIHPLGVRSADMNRIVARLWKEIGNFEKSRVWNICNELWQSGCFEEGSVACKIAAREKNDLVVADFDVFESWLDVFVSNWAHCDDLCIHAMGYVALSYPELMARSRTWTGSENRWVRRGAAVHLIPAVKHAQYLDQAFGVADDLMEDRDDLVQKGYGWLLKVASKRHEDIVFHYIMERRAVMPRTALRYAIEKMPEKRRKAAMKR